MMSPALQPTAEPPAAARAGADLRDARERLQISLEDVASTLRIRQPHLVALEEGRMSLLPGNTYALGFVRNYAATLGLDPEEMVRRFRAETAVFDQDKKLVFPVPWLRGGRSAGAMMVLSCAWRSVPLPDGIICRMRAVFPARSGHRRSRGI